MKPHIKGFSHAINVIKHCSAAVACEVHTVQLVNFEGLKLRILSYSDGILFRGGMSCPTSYIGVVGVKYCEPDHEINEIKTPSKFTKGMVSPYQWCHK